MAVVKKLLVKSPVTTDGVNPQYDENRKVVYKESFLEVGAKKHLESLNAQKAQVLKDEISIVDFDTVKNKIVTASAKTADPAAKSAAVGDPSTNPDKK